MVSYKSLFFDLDDTLWDTAANSRNSLSEAFVYCNLSRFYPDFETFYRAYSEHNEQLWAEYAAGKFDKSFLNFERFAHPFRQIGQEVGTEEGFEPLDAQGLLPPAAAACATGRQLLETFAKRFFQLIPQQKRTVPHAFDVLHILKERGYRLFILSNGFRELQYRKMKSAGLDPFFRKIILSDDIGLLKPDPRFFHFALSATQSLPRECLMIGDNLRTDILGAHHAGIDQLYFNPRRMPIPNENPPSTSPKAPALPPFPRGWRPTFEVHSLAEIPELLD